MEGLPVVSVEENVNTLESLESVVPESGGVAVIVLGKVSSMGRGDIGFADKGVSG